MAKTKQKKDGFSLRDIETGKEVKFIPNSKNGERREDAYDLWATQLNLVDCYLVDTREEEG